MQIEILPSHKIDKQKWDDCIKNSSNPLIYASSAYLDYMADNWDGFVAGDYSLVMPVPWRKKYGIKYCYRVPFIQQLGVFGKNFKAEEVEIFAAQLFKSFKYGDYSLNYLNPLNNTQQSNNYILLLSSKYEILRHFYSSHTERKLQKSKKFSLQYEEGTVDETIELFKQLYQTRIKNITEKDYKNFAALCNSKQNDIIVRKATNNNEQLAYVLLLKENHRYYNLMPSTTETGRQQCAGYFLFDSLIKEFSHSGMMLDFEGSDISGIELFYKGFGAVNQPYFKMHINNLSFPLRLFKR